MKETIKKLTGMAASVIPFSILRKISGHRLIIPVYHLVTDLLPDHIKHLYHPRNIRTFRKDMEFFTEHFTILYPDKFSDCVKNGYSELESGFIPTFDDGLREVYEIAAPFLYQMGIPAVFFVNNDFIDNKDMFFRFKAGLLVERIENHPSGSAVKKLSELLGIKEGKTYKAIKEKILDVSYEERGLLDKAAGILEVDFHEYLAVNKPYMDADQIRELQDKGFIIGAHGRDHRLLTGESEDDIVDHVRESISSLEAEYPYSLRLFAFPFTDHGIPGQVIRKLHDPAAPIVDASFGTAGLKKDIIPKHIQRIPMEKSSVSASRILKTQVLMSFCRRITGRDMITRK